MKPVSDPIPVSAAILRQHLNRRDDTLLGLKAQQHRHQSMFLEGLGASIAVGWFDFFDRNDIRVQIQLSWIDVEVSLALKHVAVAQRPPVVRYAELSRRPRYEEHHAPRLPVPVRARNRDVPCL